MSRVMCVLDGDEVGTEELLVLDAVAQALADRQGGPTALTRFIKEQLYQAVMNGNVLELTVEKS